MLYFCRNINPYKWGGIQSITKGFGGKQDKKGWAPLQWTVALCSIYSITKMRWAKNRCHQSMAKIQGLAMQQEKENVQPPVTRIGGFHLTFPGRISCPVRPWWVIKVLVDEPAKTALQKQHLELINLLHSNSYRRTHLKSDTKLFLLE